MTMLAVFMLLAFSGKALSDGGSLLVSCAYDDIECLSKSTERFLEQTHKGIPQHDIRAIDPLFISSFDVAFDTEGLIYKYKNVTVTGLRNQKISDFKMDPVAKSVILTTKADLTIVGDITATFTKVSKSFDGHFTSHASVLGTAAYSYEFKTDDKGVEHFEIGPETITCKVVESPKVELNPELLQTVSKDADVEHISQEKKQELRDKNFCKITEKAYTFVVHNIRAAARILPATDFIKNPH